MAKRGKYGQGRVYQPKYKDRNGETQVVQKWYIQYYDKAGNQRRESTDAKSEKEARGTLAVRLGQVQQGTVTKVDEKSIRYGDLREDLLRHMRVEKMKSLETLADGTETVKGLTKLDEFFGYTGSENKGIKVAAFSNDVWVDDFIEGRRKEGVSDATIANSAKLLDQMFKLAVENRRIISAPKVTVPTAPNAREEYLTKEQFDTLISKRGMDERFHPLLMFLFYQGVRIGETLSITWGQIDLNEGVFLPDAAKNKTGNKDPKPLQKDVVKILSRVPQTSDRVFEDVRSDGKHPEKLFEKAFRKAMLKLGYGGPKWQCSQCRAIKNAPAPNVDSPATVEAFRCNITMSDHHRTASALLPSCSTARAGCRMRKSWRLRATSLRNHSKAIHALASKSSSNAWMPPT